ncbi:MAG: ABC transporter ATP-binding protein/permease [Spirochaetaceae bacterium]|jgi:ATP-binding cassette subfamily B protein|nr:ABC transporter ATP-binding protein/permease [Spirochaetaceae bacterium]
MQKTSFKEFKTLFPYLRRYRWRYLWGFVCLVITDAAQATIPQFTRAAVDLISSGRFNWYAVLALGGGMVAVMALLSGGRFLWRYFIHGSSRRIEAEIRERLFAHLLTLSYDFYQKNKIGDLMARATNDLNAVRQAISMGLVAFVDGTMMAAAILVIIFIQDAKTALPAVIPLPFITALILLFGNVVGKRFRQAQETYSRMSDTVQETFAGIRVIKSFVKEWWFIKKFADTNDDYREANMGLVKLFGIFFPLISFLSGITTLIVLLVGGGRVVEGSMSPGDLVALFSYLQMLIWPLMGTGFMVNMIQRGAVSLARVNEVLRTVPAIRSPESPGQAPEVPGENIVELRRLSFSYTEGIKALDDISLNIRRGAVVGILGRTGSGKSTLIKTLTRMVDPPAGSVFVQGLDVGEWNLDELRRLFGVTPQDSYLFSDSIKQNIRYGLEKIPALPGDEGELVEKAAALSAIDRDLETFHQGGDTVIGERGLTLSGGQKQRVAISRAIIGDPEILILDDSLSAVDAETEKRVLMGLLEERRERPGRPARTTIIVSHRVSTLGYADLVVVLEKGRVSEYGSPQELVRRGGFYARMAALQQLTAGGRFSEEEGGRHG